MGADFERDGIPICDCRRKVEDYFLFNGIDPRVGAPSEESRKHGGSFNVERKLRYFFPSFSLSDIVLENLASAIRGTASERLLFRPGEIEHGEEAEIRFPGFARCTFSFVVVMFRPAINGITYNKQIILQVRRWNQPDGVQCQGR